MKWIMIVLFSIASQASLAGISIECSDSGKKLVVAFEEGQAPIPYAVYAEGSGELLGQGEFTQAQVADDGFLKSAVFALTSEESVLGAAIPGVLKANLQEGTYEAKADLFVVYGDGYMDGSSVDCTIQIQQ